MRRAAVHVVAAFASWFALAAPASAAPQGGGFATVPRVTVQDPAVFRAVFESARKAVVRVAVFGDSQETAPWGWGEHYIAGLNARFARVYGPCGESQLFTNHTAITPPMWLATMQQSAAVAAPAIADGAVLPSVTVQALLDGGGDPGGFARTVFLHDASRCSSGALVGGPWFDAVGPFRAEILQIARKGGGGIRWLNAPTDGDLPDAAAPAVQSGAFVANAKTPSGAFAWLETPVLQFAGRRHLQLVLEGDSVASGADVAGVRFSSVTARRGVVVQSFARGGMRLPQLIGEHGACGPMLRALAPTVVVLQYGANDAGNLMSTDDWRTQLAATIAWLRAELKNPALPVILAGELRFVGDPASIAMLDAMPRVAHELALADPRILALNLRRIALEEYGWGGSMRYMADTAHYRPYAQRLEAEAFVGELVRALSIADPACASQNWADCVRAWGASCQQGGCRMEPDFEVLEHGLPWQGAGTDCSDGDGDGFSDQCPPAGREDFNHDGFVDAADLGILLGAWGTQDATVDLDGDGQVSAPDLALFLSRWGA